MKRWPIVLLIAAGFLCTPCIAAVKQAPKEAPKPGTVYITETGKKYHREGCRSLAKSKIAISLQEAKQKGYTPCSVCKPDGNGKSGNGKS